MKIWQNRNLDWYEYQLIINLYNYEYYELIREVYCLATNSDARVKNTHLWHSIFHNFISQYFIICKFGIQYISAMFDRRHGILHLHLLITLINAEPNSFWEKLIFANFCQFPTIISLLRHSDVLWGIHKHISLLSLLYLIIIHL